MTRVHPFTTEEYMYLIHHTGWWEIEDDCPPALREQILAKMEREGIRNAPNPNAKVIRLR